MLKVLIMLFPAYVSEEDKLRPPAARSSSKNSPLSASRHRLTRHASLSAWTLPTRRSFVRRLRSVTRKRSLMR
jgi:hypothetical protein